MLNNAFSGLIRKLLGTLCIGWNLQRLTTPFSLSPSDPLCKPMSDIEEKAPWGVLKALFSTLTMSGRRKVHASCTKVSESYLHIWDNYTTSRLRVLRCNQRIHRLHMLTQVTAENCQYMGQFLQSGNFGCLMSLLKK